jgi:segregation and condensation protein B
VTDLKRILEAVLFASDVPLSSEQMGVAAPDASSEEIASALDDLRREYRDQSRAWRLEEVAGGWQLLTDPDLYPYVERFLEGRRKARLSRAALESLAVIAYRQPVTRGQLEEMRGVDCGGVIHTLLERDLVTVCGRSEAIGRPLLYGTTERFLAHFGLPSLGCLPRLEEMENLRASDEVRVQLEAEAEKRFGVAAPDGGDGHGPGGNGGGAPHVAAPSPDDSIALPE